MCRSMQQYFECMDDVIGTNCGQSAVDVYVGALKKVYRDPCLGLPNPGNLLPGYPPGNTTGTRVPDRKWK